MRRLVGMAIAALLAIAGVPLVASAQNGGPVTGKVSDGSFVYTVGSQGEFCSPQGGIYRTPVGGGTKTTLWSGCSSPWLVTVDGSNVYAHDTYLGKIVRIPKAGGTLTQLLNAPASGSNGALGLQVTSTQIFWGDQGGIQRANLNGSSPVTLVAAPAPKIRSVLFTDPTNIYYIFADTTTTYDSQGYPNGWYEWWELRRVPRAGGATTTMHRVQGGGSSLSVDPPVLIGIIGNNIYAGDKPHGSSTTYLRAFPKAGGAWGASLWSTTGGFGRGVVKDNFLFFGENLSGSTSKLWWFRPSNNTFGTALTGLTGASSPLADSTAIYYSAINTIGRFVVTSNLIDRDGDNYAANLDCNDNNAAIKPGATEIAADGIDQNCDGLEQCYGDADGDGARNNTLSDRALPCPALASAPLDCDDTNPLRKPGRVEACNGFDDDCDLQIDENLSCIASSVDGNSSVTFSAGTTYSGTTTVAPITCLSGTAPVGFGTSVFGCYHVATGASGWSTTDDTKWPQFCMTWDQSDVPAGINEGIMKMRKCRDGATNPNVDCCIVGATPARPTGPGCKTACSSPTTCDWDVAVFESFTLSTPTTAAKMCVRTPGFSSFAVVQATIIDSDYDAIIDGIDNCPYWWNPYQENADGDLAGDACDAYPNDPTRT